MNNKEQRLWDELHETKDEAIYQLKILIEAEWDSKTVKNKLIALVETFHTLNHEIGKVEKEIKEAKKTK